MIEGGFAIWLNMLTIVVFAFAIANIAISIVTLLVSHTFLNMQVQSRKVALWLLATFPWVASIIIALYFLNGYISPNYFDSGIEYAHWHHMNEFSWLSWHGMSLMAAMVFGLKIVIGKIMQLIRHQRDLAVLLALSGKIDDGIYEINVPEPSAFTAGFINKKCLVSSGLLAAMSDEELAVIMAHERAHAASNDPFKKWLFSTFTAFFIPPLAARLKLQMTLAMEQSADSAVANDAVSSTFVASTLVKVARLQAEHSPMTDNDLIVNFGADVLEQRIYFLLGKLNLKPMNKSVAAIFSVLVIAVCLSSIDGLHHLIETVFGH